MEDPARRFETALRRTVWLGLSQAVLIIERLIKPIAEFGLLALIALAIVGLDIPPRIPIAAHIALLAGLGVMAIWLLWRAITQRRPAPRDAARRLERAAGIAHRPLDVPQDQPIDPSHDGLWARHEARAAQALDHLRAPVPGLDARQPTLWPRALIIIAAVVGLFAGWGDLAERADRAATPLAQIIPPDPPTFDAWITPPDYTGRPVIRLAEAAIDPTRADVVAPAGSTFAVVAAGMEDAPDAQFGEAANALSVERPAPNSWRLEAELQAHDRFIWRFNGETRADFAIAVQPDEPPQIEFAGPPQRSAATSSLRLTYVGEDDYGIETVRAAVALAPSLDDAQSALDAEPLLLDFARPDRRVGREVEGEAFFDLAAHPWAGLEVLIALEAEDAAGGVGRSDVLRTVLPERVFNHPLARLLVEQRRRLSRDPALRPDVARVLEEARTPPVRYGNDTVVFLGLTVAATRLMLDETGERVPETQDLMWALALRLEDGGVSMAAEALRDLQRSLMDALDNDNALTSEIDALADQMRQAMQELLQALNEQAADQPPPSGENAAPDPNSRFVDGQDLMDMLDRALELSRSGDRDAARQMLAELQRMLENLQVAQGPDPNNPQLQAGREALDQLNEVIREQSDLADRTFRDANQGPQSGQGQDQLTDGPPASAAEQQALREALEEAMRRFGDGMGAPPPELDRARRQMEQAGEALGRNAPGAAINPQGQALEEMRAGAEAMADAMAQQFGGGAPGQSQQNARGERGQGRGRDPFGRQEGGPMGSEQRDGFVPDEAAVNRARTLIDEMRRRLRLPESPELEREYLRRLLDRF